MKNALTQNVLKIIIINIEILSFSKEDIDMEKKIHKFETVRRNSKEFVHICGDCYSDNEIKLKINEIIDVLNKLETE